MDVKDILTDIFLRCPAKLIATSRLVSRFFNSTLGDTFFAIKYEEIQERKPLVLCLKWEKYMEEKGCTSLVRWDEKQSYRSKSSESLMSWDEMTSDISKYEWKFTANIWTPEKKMEKLLEMKGWRTRHVKLTNHRGLLCIQFQLQDSTTVLVMNPRTKKSLVLPLLEECVSEKESCTRSCYLGTASGGIWTVLSVTSYFEDNQWQDVYHLITSGATTSWKTLTRRPLLHYFPSDYSKNVCCRQGDGDTLLCYGATTSEGISCLMTLSFRSEQVKATTVPTVLTEGVYFFWPSSTLANVLGNPGIGKRQVHNQLLGLWILESGSWTETLIITKSLEEALVSPMVYFEGSTADGQLLIFSIVDYTREGSKQFVGYYDLKERTFKRVSIVTEGKNIVWNHAESFMNV